VSLSRVIPFPCGCVLLVAQIAPPVSQLDPSLHLILFSQWRAPMPARALDTSLKSAVSLLQIPRLMSFFNSPERSTLSATLFPVYPLPTFRRLTALPSSDIISPRSRDPPLPLSFLSALESECVATCCGSLLLAYHARPCLFTIIFQPPFPKYRFCLSYNTLWGLLVTS